MTAGDIDRLITAYIGAHARGDRAAASAMHTDDSECALVGDEHGPVRGQVPVQRFFEQLVLDIRTEEMVPVHRYYGYGFCVAEHRWGGLVPGRLLGFDGRGRRIAFRLLHVFEFQDGRISRENVWTDLAAVAKQLSE